jgi:hypothetical protein
VNPLGDNIDTINKNTGTIVDDSKEIGLETNVGKTKYMLLYRRENSDQNRDLKLANRSSENVPQFRYLGTTVTNQILLSRKLKED